LVCAAGFRSSAGFRLSLARSPARGLFCPCGLFLSMWFSLGLLACCFSWFSTFSEFSLSLAMCDYFGSSILGSVWIRVCLSVSPLLCLSSLHRGLLAFAVFGLHFLIEFFSGHYLLLSWCQAFCPTICSLLFLPIQCATGELVVGLWLESY
jgi:hypothetical protein